MDKDFFDVTAAPWRRIEPLLPEVRPKPKSGFPRVPGRVATAGILYCARAGCQWRALPPEFGLGLYVPPADDAVGARLRVRQYPQRAPASLRATPRNQVGLRFARQRDGQGPKRGSGTGQDPTDRGKLGVKRNVFTDGRDVPLAVLITGANVHDKWMVAPIFDDVVLHGRFGPGPFGFDPEAVDAWLDALR
jgi:transposase